MSHPPTHTHSIVNLHGEKTPMARMLLLLVFSKLSVRFHIFVEKEDSIGDCMLATITKRDF